MRGLYSPNYSFQSSVDRYITLNCKLKNYQNIPIFLHDQLNLWCRLLIFTFFRLSDRTRRLIAGIVIASALMLIKLFTPGNH